MKLLCALSTMCALAATALAANQSPGLESSREEQAEKLLLSLRPQKGEVTIVGGKVKLNLGTQFEFLNPSDTRKVVVDFFGNPPDVGSHEGMIVPAGWALRGGTEWCAVIDMKNDGYVKDEEYDSIDFTKMLSDLKEGFSKSSEERVRQGYSKLLLVGWAQPPHYDKTSHKLYWAKEIDGGGPIHQLDYDIDVLGRAGVLQLKIIDGMPNLAKIQAEAPAILSAIEFTPTNRYTDYQKGDKVAEYTIGGLIGVGILAKAGFFKVLLLGLAKFWKLVALGVAAIGSFFAKLFGRRKNA